MRERWTLDVFISLFYDWLTFFFIASLIVVCLLYYSDNYVTESKGVYFVIALLLAIVTCVVDSIEVAYQIIKLYRTQKNIIEANVESWHG